MHSISLETIKAQAQAVFEEVVANRRHLHAHPELSFQEYKTAAFIAEKLQQMGIKTQTGVAQTGVVGLIEGENPDKKTVALRADIDALPIEETNTCTYRSTNPGVMHACGHDVHTASLLGVAKILQANVKNFEGTIKLIFQPGEEKVPGGASLMIKAGVLENPAPQSIIGQHVMPLLPVGKIGFRSGKYMASADEIYMKIVGKGGHGAMPEQLVDPVMVACQVLLALQQVVSRKANPKIPTVLSFGKIIAQGATNIIPESVEIEGTLRTFDEAWRTNAHAHITKIAQGIASSLGAECQLEIRKGYPFLTNDIALTEKMQKAAIAYMGAEHVVDLDLWMAAEDFAYYSQVMPACFYRLGTANAAKNIISGVHTSSFDIDEQALLHSTGLMAWLALSELYQ